MSSYGSGYLGPNKNNTTFNPSDYNYQDSNSQFSDVVTLTNNQFIQGKKEFYNDLTADGNIVIQGNLDVNNGTGLIYSNNIYNTSAITTDTITSTGNIVSSNGYISLGGLTGNALIISPNNKAGAVNTDYCTYDISGGVKTHYFTDNVEIPNNLTASGTSNLNTTVINGLATFNNDVSLASGRNLNLVYGTLSCFNITLTNNLTSTGSLIAVNGNFSNAVTVTNNITSGSLTSPTITSSGTITANTLTTTGLLTVNNNITQVNASGATNRLSSIATASQGANRLHGSIEFIGTSRGSFSSAIRSYATNTATSGNGLLGWDDTGDLEFYTASIGGSGTRRMIISENGNVLIGPGYADNNTLFTVSGSSNTTGNLTNKGSILNNAISITSSLTLNFPLQKTYILINSATCLISLPNDLTNIYNGTEITFRRGVGSLSTSIITFNTSGTTIVPQSSNIGVTTLSMGSLFSISFTLFQNYWYQTV